MDFLGSSLLPEVDTNVDGADARHGSVLDDDGTENVGRDAVRVALLVDVVVLGVHVDVYADALECAAITKQVKTPRKASSDRARTSPFSFFLPCTLFY
jgi:hypothetical protein